MFGQKHEQDSVEMDVQKIDTTKDGKTYSVQMRMAVYAMLDSHTPTSNLPFLLKVMYNNFKVDAQSIPVRSSIERMAIEMGVLSDIFTADVLYSTPGGSIAFDASSQNGVHFNAIYLTMHTKPEGCIHHGC